MLVEVVTHTQIICSCKERSYVRFLFNEISYKNTEMNHYLRVFNQFYLICNSYLINERNSSIRSWSIKILEVKVTQPIVQLKGFFLIKHTFVRWTSVPSWHLLALALVTQRITTRIPCFGIRLFPIKTEILIKFHYIIQYSYGVKLYHTDIAKQHILPNPFGQ